MLVLHRQGGDAEGEYPATVESSGLADPARRPRGGCQLVMPVTEHQALRVIAVRKVDQFIETVALTKGYATAEQACTVLMENMNVRQSGQL